MLRAADLAMYRAKVGGKNDVCEFAPSMCAEAAAGGVGEDPGEPDHVGTQGRLAEAS